ncbi:MAG: ubiquinol-cytochrome c reductase iron-sulfur subunit N-terminal domain-containing protein, partial [Hydrogenobaculum sp.]
MEASRRDFMQYVLGAFGAVAAVGVAYPILKSLGPS